MASRAGADTKTLQVGLPIPSSEDLSGDLKDGEVSLQVRTAPKSQSGHEELLAGDVTQFAKLSAELKEGTTHLSEHEELHDLLCSEFLAQVSSRTQEGFEAALLLTDRILRLEPNNRMVLEYKEVIPKLLQSLSLRVHEAEMASRAGADTKTLQVGLPIPSSEIYLVT